MMSALRANGGWCYFFNLYLTVMILAVSMRIISSALIPLDKYITLHYFDLGTVILSINALYVFS